MFQAIILEKIFLDFPHGELYTCQQIRVIKASKKPQKIVRVPRIY